MSLTAKFLRSYTSKASNERRAIYTVNGPTKELEAYKAFQGSYGVDETTGNAIIFGDAPIDRSKVYNIIFSEDLDRYYVDFSYLQDANATVTTAKKRLTAELASEVIRMEAVELRGAPRSIAQQSAAVSKTEATSETEAASETADFDAEIEQESEESES